MENIAYGYPGIESCFQGWHYSSGHWAAITSDTPEAGFGCAATADGTLYWAGVYGYPAQEETEASEGAETTTYVDTNYRRRARRRR